MKQRMVDNQKSNNTSVPMDGIIPEWTMKGFVQKVTENKAMKLDYVTFKITRSKTAYTSFTVSVPHSLGVLCEVGDAVEIDGTIRTWWDDKAGKVFIELIAENVEAWVN